MFHVLVSFAVLIFCSFTNTCHADCNADCQNNCLFIHNIYRKNHGAEPLTLESSLSAQAQKWADSGVIGSSKWARGLGGECWAYGDIFQSWFHVVKAWHDQEGNFDWATYKAKDYWSNVHCFLQVVWKSAKLLGCGKAYIKGKPYYVAQMDKTGVIVDGLLGYERINVDKPEKPDLQWFPNATTFIKEIPASTVKIVEQPKTEDKPIHGKEDKLLPIQP